MWHYSLTGILTLYQCVYGFGIILNDLFLKQTKQLGLLSLPKICDPYRNPQKEDHKPL